MKIEKTFHFLAGLPRSGSTVLQSILSQNPDIFVTPTSPLMDMLVLTEQAWGSITQARTYDHPDQLQNIYRGVINGSYHHIDKPIIIDKHRAWARNLRGIREYFPEAGCICTVRSIPDIIASFIILLDKQTTASNYINDELSKRRLKNTMENKADLLWQGYVENTWESLYIGCKYNKEYLLLIEYDDLIKRPEHELERVYSFLNLPYYNQHSFTHIANATPEKDEHWGLQGLHDIRPTLSKVSPPAIDVLGKKVYNKYKQLNKEFWR